MSGRKGRVDQENQNKEYSKNRMREREILVKECLKEMEETIWKIMTKNIAKTDRQSKGKENIYECKI